MPAGPWQPFVDENMVGTGMVAAGIIMTLKGELLAYSPCLQITQDEMTQIAKSMEVIGDDTLSNPFTEEFSKMGATISGTKYISLRAMYEEGLVYLKFKSAGVCLVKTEYCIIIGIYTEGMAAGECNMVTEGLAEYLRDEGY